MQAGRLDRKIIIQQVTEARSGSGAVTETWATWKTVWANARPMRGDENFAARQEIASREVAFRIRWLSGLTPKMRISYDGMTWDIEHIEEIGMREGFDIRARAMGD